MSDSYVAGTASVNASFKLPSQVSNQRCYILMIPVKRKFQRRMSISVSHGWICALSRQQPVHISVITPCSFMQWGPSVSFCSFGIGPPSRRTFAVNLFLRFILKCTGPNLTNLLTHRQNILD